MTKFSKEDLKGMVYEDYDPEVYEIIYKNIEDTSRWSNIYEMVFKVKPTGKFYRTGYSVGATECQDESPYEYDSDMIECVEVLPKEVTKIEYVPVQEEE